MKKKPQPTHVEQRTMHRRPHCFSSLFHAIVARAWAYGGIAHADGADRLRVMSAVNKFHDTHLFSVAYETDGFHWLRAHHAEWSFGVITHRGKIRPYAAYGPVWRLGGPVSPWHVEFSVSPTLLGEPRLGDRTLGGHVHFGHALSIGRRLGNSWELALHAQHISNGSLHRHNPGLDSFGLSLIRRTGR